MNTQEVKFNCGLSEIQKEESCSDSLEKEVKKRTDIQPQIVNSWLEHYQGLQKETLWMGDGDYVQGVCWPG